MNSSRLEPLELALIAERDAKTMSGAGDPTDTVGVMEEDRHRLLEHVAWQEKRILEIERRRDELDRFVNQSILKHTRAADMILTKEKRE